jgi:hypothetical protein
MSRSCHDDDRQTWKSTQRAAINESMNPAARRMTRVDPLFFNPIDRTWIPGCACSGAGGPGMTSEVVDVLEGAAPAAQVTPEKHRTIPRAGPFFCSFFHSHPAGLAVRSALP